MCALVAGFCHRPAIDLTARQPGTAPAHLPSGRLSALVTGEGVEGKQAVVERRLPGSKVAMLQDAEAARTTLMRSSRRWPDILVSTQYRVAWRIPKHPSCR